MTQADSNTPAPTSAGGPKTAAPSVVVAGAAKSAVLKLAGEWTVRTAGSVEADIPRKIDEAGGRPAGIDLSGVTRMDTTGALLIRKTMRLGGLERSALASLDEHHRHLIELAGSGVDCPEKRPGPSPIAVFVNSIGETIAMEYHLARKLMAFLGHYIVEVAAAVRRPSRIPFTPLVHHMEQVGVSAVPIVALLAFLIGLVIAYMGGQQLAWFGMQIFVVNLVEIVTLRELGVLLTAIVIAGRSGSSFTAEIGAMIANEEVAAMRSMGLSPMLRLAFPRITALVIMLPALVFLADIMGLLGGGVATWMTMGLSPSSYAARMQEIVKPNNVFVGLTKAPFFAVIIGTVGCFHGFQVTGSAESVGRLTTQSVVESIFLVIVLDALFAIFFSSLGV
jgi:phospholipid/cholesterol/gamma-HCH transport system permease protein